MENEKLTKEGKFFLTGCLTSIIGFGVITFGVIRAIINYAYEQVLIWGAVWVAYIIVAFIFNNKTMEKSTQSIENAIKAIPLTTVSATVISKLHEKNVEGMVGITGTKHAYYVVFEFSDKQREKFTLDKSQYALLKEGDTGILSYRSLNGPQFNDQLRFVDFQLN